MPAIGAVLTSPANPVFPAPLSYTVTQLLVPPAIFKVAARTVDVVMFSDPYTSNRRRGEVAYHHSKEEGDRMLVSVAAKEIAAAFSAAEG